MQNPATRDKLTFGLLAAAGPRLVVATGGSGGHICPALAFAEAFEKRNAGAHVFFTVGSKPIEERLMSSVPRERVFKLRGTPFRGPVSLLSHAFLASLKDDFVYSRDLLRSLRPEIVAGFGGYASFPTVLAARALGIPSVIHEQNAATGLANRVLSLVADKIAYSFPPAHLGPKDVLSGMPLRLSLRRMDRAAALGRLDLDPGRRTLGVSGGSQGAHALNEAVRDFLKSPFPGFAQGWQVVHLAGEDDFGSLKAFYEALAIPYRLFSFCDDMSIIYSGCDLIVSRAGSVTLHELALFAKGAVLIPYPGAGAHQASNAAYLERRGAAAVIREDGLAGGRLGEVIAEAERNPAWAGEMGSKLAAALKTDGADALAEEVVKTAGENSR